MAQTKKVTVELGFKANTEAVKRNINELTANLKQISNMQIGLKGSDLDQAKKAAKELTLELQKAVNVDTGRLDLNKLTTNLKKGHKDIVGLSSELLKAGPIGQKSFLQIAQAMSQAEVPMVKINQNLKDFMENLGKTAKWQIAQMAIQGVQGSIQNAVREAEQLNKALNDIRIVTGYDKTVMAQFAKEANKAAKELKTTTKEYAEASLIFYQQGLSEAEVAKRAETVIKMSQVTGDTAKAVSDQMTAIWNNFADGTKTLEYYADAMAKLGAETAASTSEIANSLEKFAAIAETVGLSYETAMASVATVIDKTRQSADVVGTAFKTIFARVQGLSLDGVTDDGVTLNKYSAALKRVGVDVLTTSGELRDMDEILNDLGAKWQLLGRESQVAVAQVVGGARQYNQLLSLMDNWSEVQSNIVKAEGSTGEISKQANIWADSYEAASKRVEEAKARATENFLNSEDVVNLTNAFADLITWVDKFIDSFGGVVPLALTITGLFSRKLVPIAKTGFTALSDNFKAFMGNTLGTSEKLIKDTQNEFNNFLETYKKGDIEDSLRAQIEWNQKLIKVKQNMAEITKYMSEQEKESAMAALSIFEESVQAAIQAGEALTKSQRDVKTAKKKITKMDMSSGAEKQFFEKHGIEYEDERNKIREYAREDVQKKIDLIGTKDEVQGQISSQEKNLAQKKGQLSNLLQGKDIEQVKKDFTELGNLYAFYDAEGNQDALQEVSEQIEQLRLIIDLEKEINIEETKLLNTRQRLDEIQIYEQDRAALEKAKDLQGLNKQLDTGEGRMTASFGTTSFDVDKDITLAQGDRYLYEKKIKQVKDEKALIDGQEIGLSFDSSNGQIQNSVQNYEVLRTKALEYKIVAEELSHINSEIADNIQNAVQSQKDLTKLENERAQALSAEMNAKREEEAAEEALSQTPKDTEEYIQAEQALKIAKEKRKKASEELEKVEKKLAKASEHNVKVSKNGVKAIQDNKKQILDLAKKAGYSETAIGKLGKKIDSLGEHPEDLVNIAKKLKSFQEVALSTAGTLDILGDSVYDALSENMNPEHLEGVKKTLDDVEQKTLANVIAQKKAAEHSEEFGKKISGFGDKFESIVAGVGQTTAAIAGLSAGVTQMFEVFESGSSPIEKFTGTLGALVSAAPAVITAVKAVGAAQQWAAKTAKDAANKEKKTILELLAVKLTGKLAEGTASLNPAIIAGALAGIAIAATIGLSVASNVSANNKEKQREQNTAAIEAAEKSNEIASATKTESQAIDELISQYNQLNATQEDTVAIKEDIINQTDKAIEKYKEYVDSVNMAIDAQNELKDAIQELEDAKTLGDVASIKRAQEKVDSLIAKTAKEKNELGIAGTLGNIGLKEDAQQVKVKDGYVQRQVGGAGAEEVEANSILQKAMGESVVKFRDRGTRIKLRTDSAEHFVEDYDKLQTAVDNMLKSSNSRVKDPNINDTLRECQELLSTYQEEYNSLKSQIATGAAYNAQIAIGNVAKTGHSVSNINKYTDYKKYKQAVQDEIENSDLTDKEKSDALESLDSQLSANSELKKYTDLEKKLDIIAEKGTDARDRLEKLLDGVDIWEKPKDIAKIRYRVGLVMQYPEYQQQHAQRPAHPWFSEYYAIWNVRTQLSSLLKIRNSMYSSIK